MTKISSFISNPYLNFVAVILTIFTFFGISSGTVLGILRDYSWIEPSRWSLILGAFIFAIHAYVRAEKNRKHLINMRTSAFDEAYKNFTNKLSYVIGRYKGYRSNLAPEEKKYTEVGVWEGINEVKSTRLQLLLVCGKHVRSILMGAGTDWLDDIQSFGKTAPSIMQKLSEIASKDRL